MIVPRYQMASGFQCTSIVCPTINCDCRDSFAASSAIAAFKYTARRAWVNAFHWSEISVALNGIPSRLACFDRSSRNNVNARNEGGTFPSRALFCILRLEPRALKKGGGGTRRKRKKEEEEEQTTTKKTRTGWVTHYATMNQGQTKLLLGLTWNNAKYTSCDNLNFKEILSKIPSVGGRIFAPPPTFLAKLSYTAEEMTKRCKFLSSFNAANWVEFSLPR